MISNYHPILQNQAQRSYGPIKDLPKADHLNVTNVVTQLSALQHVHSTLRLLWLLPGHGHIGMEHYGEAGDAPLLLGSS